MPKLIIRSVYWYITFILAVVPLVPKFFIARRKQKKIPPLEFNIYANEVVRRFAVGAIRRTGASFNVEGLENIPRDEPVVFVANHQGDFDIAAFLAFLPVPHGYIAKVEILKVPIIRDWMKLIHCVFIDRKNIRQSAAALLEGVEILKAGQSLVLFPEGTRSKGPIMGEFKAAAFKLATRAGVAIVPVSISGSYLIYEENKRLIKPAEVRLCFHTPVKTDVVEEHQQLPAKVRAIIEEGIK